MALTKTAICNGALLLLGQEGSLVDVDTDQSVFAGDLLNAWNTEVDAALRAYPWNFAMEYQAIGVDEADGKFGFTKRYTWPSEPFCLRAWKLDPQQHGRDAAWKAQGRYIFTDEGSPIYLHYIKRVDDTGLFDAEFVKLLELHLAWKCALKITGSTSARDDMGAMLRNFRPEATAIDAQESGVDAEGEDEGEFLSARW